MKRIHEIAKELAIPLKEVLEASKALGYDVNNHMSTLSLEQAREVRLYIKNPEQVVATDKQTEDATAQENAPPEEPENLLLVKTPLVVVKDFAELLDIRPNQLIAELMGRNIFASINQTIELDIAKEIAEKHGFVLETEKEHKKKMAPPPPQPAESDSVSEEAKKKKKKRKIRTKGEDAEPLPEGMFLRPPVVTFMGHVDHGKTTLMDRIRNARVAKGEAGGITQHIGAYTISHEGKEITFMDTPGHAAFTKMRARGADLTDIAVIIIAADEGIKPQTLEAIEHARAADVAIMVALNKMDLPNANPDNVKKQLQEHGLLPEDWGGETICCEVSAHTGEGLDELMEYIHLQAEILELSARKAGPASGYVIEAQLEKGRGPTATVLVKEGVLKVGDAMVCDTIFGKVKALINDLGKNVKESGPSHAAKIMGLTDVPPSGARFEVFKNEREAKTIAEQRQAERRKDELSQGPEANSLEALLAMTNPDSKEKLTLVVKADAQGSLEAIEQLLGDIPAEKVELEIKYAGIGSITENDVTLASTTESMIIGFQVKEEGQAKKAAKKYNVETRTYDIIYKLVDDITLAMKGMLSPEFKEKPTGKAEIRQIFSLGKKGAVAGCVVLEGRIGSGSKVRVRRKRNIIHEGEIESLRRYQDDVNEVRNGQECGISLKNYHEFKEGDTIEAYVLNEVDREL